MNEVLTTVRYYLWAEKGMLVCMYACTCAGLGGAGLGGAVLASLSESNEKKKTDESKG